MKIRTHLLARLGVLPLLVILSVASASAQTSPGKTIVEKLTAKIAKLESTCASDIKKYCKAVTPGEGRMIYFQFITPNFLKIVCECHLWRLTLAKATK